MGEKIKKIQMVFPEDGFIASPVLQKNKKAFELLKETFSGKTIDVDVSKVKDEEVEKYLNDLKADNDNNEEKIDSYRIGIDFDSTCVCEEFPEIGPSIPEAVEVMKQLVNKGHRLILWTARKDKLLDDAVKWFNDNRIVLYGINDDPSKHSEDLNAIYGKPRKMVPDFYIDDRNLGIPMKKMSANGKTYKVVDWNWVKNILTDKGIL